MVLPLFFADLPAAPEVGVEVRLFGPEAKHAISVRRMRVGEGIQLANGSGLRVVGEVSGIFGTELHVRVSSWQQESMPEPTIRLIQALAKGDRDELAIQAATELGIAGVTPWQADRSVSRWDGAKLAKGVERWQTIVAEASKQALRASTPQVANSVTTNQLCAQISQFSAVLVLDPTAPLAISEVALPGAGELAIVVGPEGGISEAELETLEVAGAIRVRLGQEILRTSTAGMAAISALQIRLQRW